MGISRKFTRLLLVASLLAGLFQFGLGPVPPARAAGTINLYGLGAYTQDFDTLAASGNSSAMPDGWEFFESGSNADAQYTAGTGSSTTGDTYSFGATNAQERAFGGLLSGSLKPTIGASFTNATGAPIGSLAISYTGEQWRLGAVTRTDRMDFQYSLDATSLNTGTWVDVDALDFTSPSTAGTSGSRNGNDPAYRASVNGTISGLNLANGATFWIRWQDMDASGGDDGLAVDDFSLTTAATVPPPQLSVYDVTLNEGGAGTTTFTFAVGLSSPAPAGGVTFDIATADGTATAGSDYAAVSLSAQVIPAGSTLYNLDVTVHGDWTHEADETFLVNVSNVGGATILDGQGLGTIINDDAVPSMLSIQDVTSAEGDSGARVFSFVVSLDPPAPANGVSFDIATADGTASAGSDYIPAAVDGVTLISGQNSYAFDVTVHGDTDIETGETFFVNVTNVVGALIADGQALGTITNDDVAVPRLSIADLARDEGNAGDTLFTFTVSLDIPAPPGGVTFDIAAADDTAVAGSDYDAKSLIGQTIPAGNTSYTFDVAVHGDLDVEAEETFFARVSNVSGADVADGQATATIHNDDQTLIPVCIIQGSGAATALSGQAATLGVVVGDYEGASPSLGGFYIQAEHCDGNPATSDGLFVYNGSRDDVALGDLVRVTGNVSESAGQTQVIAVAIDIVSSGHSLAPLTISLPFGGADDRERYEGMLVRVPQTLYVTEHYLLGRFGQVTLSGAGRLVQPTQVELPGAPAQARQAANDLNQILLDDSSLAQNPDPIHFAVGGPLSAGNTLRGGDTVSGLVGVFTYTWGGHTDSPPAYRILPLGALDGGLPTFVASNPRPSVPPVVGGNVRAVGMNLLNYFNTFNGCTAGEGGAPIACRGADGTVEFNRQSAKIVNAILAVDADVIGLVEIENDGYGASSAIQDLATKLNAAAGPGTYAFVNPDPANGVNSLGVDAVKVGILYKPAVLTPVGTPSVLNSAAFVNGGDGLARNRPALLQAFEAASGRRFLFNVNHLKSKGSACDTPDSGDGQGNCSQVRVNAVRALLDWFSSDPTGTGESDILIVGDLNSYAREDPIAVFEAAGYTNLTGAAAYSYAYGGQWGTLDYALASPSLFPQVSAAADWHINADEPLALDYNTEYKTVGQIASLYSPDPFRAADHDPVLVGLNLGAGDPVHVRVRRADANPSNAASLRFSVEFSETVTGVDALDFSPTGGVSGAAITGVSGSGSRYTVTLTTGSGDGSLGLGLSATPSILDGAGQPCSQLQFNGESYQIDKTAPSVLSIVRGGVSPTTAANLPFTVTFSEAVTGLGLEDFVATAPSMPGVSIGSLTTLNNTTWTVNVNTVAGAGSLRLDIPHGAVIMDLAGNPLGAPYTAGESYTVDRLPPTVLSILRAGVSPTHAASVDFAVTFSEPVQNVGVGDFSLAAFGVSGAAIANVSGSGASYTVTVNTGSGDGTLRLDVRSSPTIQDALGNPLSGPYQNGESYALDRTAPRVTSIRRQGASPTNASSLVFAVTFSEPVIGVEVDDFRLADGAPSGASLTGLGGLGADYTVTAGTGSGDGTLRLDLALAASVQDAAGNLLTSPYTGGESYQVDRTAPTVVSVKREDTNPTSAATANFSVTFSEAVSGLGLSDFSLAVSGVSGAKVIGVGDLGAGLVYRVTVLTGSGNGSLRLDLPASATITDRAGNTVGGLPFSGGETYTVRKIAVFADVPLTHWAIDWVERLHRNGVTGGCSASPLLYCPDASITRDQMAIFLLRAKHGSSYAPPAVGASTGFADVPVTHWAAAWIKQLAAESITTGCGGGNYCPSAAVTRDQMAVFLLKAKYGSSYTPPAVGASTGFADVPTTHWAAAWIKQLAAESVTSGCDGENYCPSATVTRAQMAVFLGKAFNLP